MCTKFMNTPKIKNKIFFFKFFGQLFLKLVFLENINFSGLFKQNSVISHLSKFSKKTTSLQSRPVTDREIQRTDSAETGSFRYRARQSFAKISLLRPGPTEIEWFRDRVKQRLSVRDRIWQWLNLCNTAYYRHLVQQTSVVEVIE